MTYLIEGVHAAGKSTYANSLGLPVENHAYADEQEIKDAVNIPDIAYDRLFGLAICNRVMSGDYSYIFIIKELNEYFKTLPNLKCLMFICDREKGWERQQQKTSIQMTRKQYDDDYNKMVWLFNLMDCFEIVNIDAMSEE